MAERSSVVADRKVAALRQAMGPVIAAALADKRVVEVMVNPDGKIWIDKIGEGRSFTGERLEPDAADRILRLLADHVGRGGHQGSAADQRDPAGNGGSGSRARSCRSSPTRPSLSASGRKLSSPWPTMRRPA